MAQVTKKKAATVSASKTVTPLEPIEAEMPQVEEPAASFSGAQQPRNYSATPEPISALFKRFTNPARLTSEGRAYIETIIDNIAHSPMGVMIKNMLVTTGDIDACVFYKPVNFGSETKDVAVVLLFHETMGNPNELPTSKVSAILEQFKVNNQKQGKVNDVLLINTVTIIPEEYGQTYAIKMANSIMNSFTAQEILVENKFNVETIGGNTLMVVTNMQEVRAYVAQHSPHLVAERDDIGFLVRTGFRTRSNDVIPGEVLFAVTGYTKFVTPREIGSQSNRIRPVPTISAIVSRAPLFGYLPLAIAIATECFCTKGMWRDPYRNLAKGRPNLGYFIDQPDGKRRPITTSHEFDTVIAAAFDIPLLAIDITEGRYSFPNMMFFASNPTELYNTVEQFFCVPSYYKARRMDDESIDKLMHGPGPQVMKPAFEYNAFNGVILDESGKPADTRLVDFPLLANTFDDYNVIRAFLYQPGDPAERINQIRAHYTNTRLLYNTKTLVFDPNALAYIFTYRLGNAKFDFHTDYTANTGNLNMASVLDAISANMANHTFILPSSSNQFGNMFNTGNTGMYLRPY